MNLIQIKDRLDFNISLYEYSESSVIYPTIMNGDELVEDIVECIFELASNRFENNLENSNDTETLEEIFEEFMEEHGFSRIYIDSVVRLNF